MRRLNALAGRPLYFGIDLYDAWKQAHGDKYWQYFEPFLKQMYTEGIFKDTNSNECKEHTIVREMHTTSADEYFAQAARTEPCNDKIGHICPACDGSPIPDDEGRK